MLEAKITAYVTADSFTEITLFEHGVYLIFCRQQRHARPKDLGNPGWVFAPSRLQRPSYNVSQPNTYCRDTGTREPGQHLWERNALAANGDCDFRYARGRLPEQYRRSHREGRAEALWRRWSRSSIPTAARTHYSASGRQRNSGVRSPTQAPTTLYSKYSSASS